MSGKAELKVGKIDKNIFVGPVNKPVAILMISEISSYLTEEFWAYYEVWLNFDCGLGLPNGDGWLGYPSRFVEVLSAMINEGRSLKHGNSK